MQTQARWLWFPLVINPLPYCGCSSDRQTVTFRVFSFNRKAGSDQRQSPDCCERTARVMPALASLAVTEFGVVQQPRIATAYQTSTAIQDYRLFAMCLHCRFKFWRCKRGQEEPKYTFLKNKICVDLKPIELNGLEYT